jgi:uncharacterized membrane protein YqjE
LPDSKSANIAGDVDSSYELAEAGAIKKVLDILAKCTMLFKLILAIEKNPFASTLSEISMTM